MEALTVGNTVLEPGSLFGWLIIGIVAGALAGRLVQGRGLGCFGDLVVGIVGAFLGGIIVSVTVGGGAFGFWSSLVVAIIGAVIFLALIRALSGRRA